MVFFVYFYMSCSEEYEAQSSLFWWEETVFICIFFYQRSTDSFYKKTTRTDMNLWMCKNIGMARNRLTTWSVEYSGEKKNLILGIMKWLIVLVIISVIPKMKC